MTKKSAPTCTFEGCKRPKRNGGHGSWGKFCRSHVNKATINGFLLNLYHNMKKRVDGRGSHNRGNWKGKPILPKDVFYTWAKNNPEFFKLYKRWFTNGFDRKLTPSINRMNSTKGYTLDNMEWMTNSSNCGLSGAVQQMKKKKAIYDLLGVNK
jgi:hypothetical protein